MARSYIKQDCVGVEPVGWSYAGDGHSLEELEYGIVECLWHVFNKHSWDVVGARGFVARKESKSYVENGGVTLPMIPCCRGEGGLELNLSRGMSL